MTTRDGELFILRSSARIDTVVLLTAATTIKTERKGLFRGRKEFDVTVLGPGLILTVKSKGDAEGRLVAESITFKESDYKAAVTAFAMTDPIDDKADLAPQNLVSTGIGYAIPNAPAAGGEGEIAFWILLLR